MGSKGDDKPSSSSDATTTPGASTSSISTALDPYVLAESMLADPVHGGGLAIGSHKDPSDPEGVDVIRQCFSGEEATSWLRSRDTTISPAEAVRACSRLLTAGLVRPVDADQGAHIWGDALLFRFVAHDRSAFRFTEKGSCSLPDSFDSKF